MASPRRTTKKKPADVRDALVQHASAIIEERGGDALNLRELARRVGVSQPAMYRHFESKAALLDEIVLRGTTALGVEISERMKDACDAYEVMGAFGHGYLAYSVAHRGWFRLTFSRDASSRGMLEAERLAPFMHTRMRCLAALACIVPHDQPVFGHTFRALWALAHGLASLVNERAFRLVDSDDARLVAARAALDEHMTLLRARWGTPRSLDAITLPFEPDLTLGL